MRHDLYIDSYRRYKRGTAKVAQWIANAGRLCGATLDSGVSKSGRKYLMPLSKLRELAEIIANCKEPEIEIRPELLDLLKEVIALRKAASVFFQHNSSSNELFNQSNEGHLFTIEVLEEVLALLAPLRKTEPSNTTTTHAQGDEPIDHPSNIFDALDVEDIAEPTVHHDLVKGSKGKKGSKTRSKGQDDAFELGSTIGELFFTLFCFFKDLHDIQTFLLELWDGYKNGSMPLTSVAVTTDLAFDIVKRKEDEMLQSEWTDTNGITKTVSEAFADMQKERTSSAVPLFWRWQKEGSLLNHGYLGELLYSYLSDLNADKLPRSGMVDTVTQERLYQMADWLYTPAYVLLDRLDVATAGGDGGGMPQRPASTKERSTSSDMRRRFEKNFEDLANVVCEFVQLRAAGMDQTITCDVWTKSVFELIDPNKKEIKKRMGDRQNRQSRNHMPVWMTFATTVYLDICKLLGSGIGRGFQELTEQGKKTAKTFNQMLQWCRHNPDPAWTKQHSDILERKMKMIKLHIQDDPVAMINKSVEYPGGPTNSPHYLMRHHPLWAGIVMFELQLSRWDTTIEMMNIYAGAWQVTHLYALTFTEINCEWPDMEYLIDLHGPGHLYYGGRPSTVSECCRKYELSLGFSAQNAAKNRHGNRHKSARGMSNAARQHRPYAITSDLLNMRYEAIRMRQGPPEGPQTTLPALELVFEVQKRMPDEMLVKKEDQSAYLVPLLSIVGRALAEDIQHLTFDYFSMHLRCWKLMERIHTEVHDDLARIVGRMPQPSQLELRMRVGHILQVAGAASKGRSDNQKIGVPMIVTTQKMVKDFAAEQGSEGLDMVKKTLAEHEEDIKPFPRNASSTGRTTMADSDDDSEVDSNDLAAFTAALSMAPNRTVTDDQAREFLKRTKGMSMNQMPPSVRRHCKNMEESGIKLAGKGVMGLLQATYDATARLTTEQQEELMTTKTLEEYNDMLDRFKAEEAEDMTVAGAEKKKKRNNKNKNKNRKLKQKEEKASGGTDALAVASRSGMVPASDQDEENDSSRALTRGNALQAKPVVGKRSWLTFQPSHGPDLAAYQEAKRQGKMIIDGEEFTFTGRNEFDINPSELSDQQRDQLAEMLTMQLLHQQFGDEAFPNL